MIMVRFNGAQRKIKWQNLTVCVLAYQRAWPDLGLDNALTTSEQHLDAREFPLAGATEDITLVILYAANSSVSAAISIDHRKLYS